MSTPLPVITNGWRLAHNYGTADATFTNVYWFITGDATVGSSFSMKALHSSNVTFLSCDVTALDGISPTVNVPYSSGVHGGGASPAVAANSALVVTWETGARGRSNRGRSFLAGMPGASLETGGAQWGTAILTDAADAID